MKSKSVFVGTILIGFLMVSVSMFAHHGTGVSYDMQKVVVLKGVVTEFDLRNPHSQLFFDVEDDKGNVVRWAAEMRAPGNLRSYGHTRLELTTKFAPGAVVTVTGNPSRGGAPVLVFGKAVTADGWCLCNHEGGIGSDMPGAPPQHE